MKIIYSLYFTQIYISGDSERPSPEVFQTTAARISKLTNARISAIHPKQLKQVGSFRRFLGCSIITLVARVRTQDAH